MNFSLMKAGQATGGLLTVLVPEEAGGQLARNRAVFAERNAFGFLDPFISQCWPDYANPIRKREYRIPAEVWLRIIECLSEFRAALMRAQAPEALTGMGFVMGNQYAAPGNTFAQTQQGIAGLISELVMWLQRELQSCECIAIVDL